MNLLALDTSTDYLSCAVAKGDEIMMRVLQAGRDQSAELLPMVVQVLDDAGLQRTELQGIAFARGPGSFTGLRVATAAAQGIAMALQLPLVGVSSLAALAAQSLRLHGQQRCLVTLDARMGEVYWAAFEYRQSAWEEVVAERVSAPQLVAVPDEHEWFLCGTGASLCAPYLIDLAGEGAGGSTTRAGAGPEPVGDGMVPLAHDVITLSRECFRRGDTLAPAKALPVYLRNQVALTEAERQQKRVKS